MTLEIGVFGSCAENPIQIGSTDRGPVILRDQKPMSLRTLRDSLVDMSPEDWLMALNSKVFFWPTLDRLKIMMRARPYRHLEHVVLILDTKSAISKNFDDVWISTINSGATIPWKHPRGRNTFIKPSDLDLNKRIRAAGSRRAIAEVAFEGRLEHVDDFLVTAKTIGLADLDTLADF